ncbi:unnamed protein product, partial [Polarella glacialis]
VLTMPWDCDMFMTGERLNKLGYDSITLDRGGIWECSFTAHCKEYIIYDKSRVLSMRSYPWKGCLQPLLFSELQEGDARVDESGQLMSEFITWDFDVLAFTSVRIEGTVPRAMRLLLVSLSLPVAWAALEVSVQRPATAAWKRTQCGGPTGPADIPSSWGAQVSPERTPLEYYPRPQLARLSQQSTLPPIDRLRDAGDPATWSNLNGLWEWSEEPEFGKALSSSILVPFPVESCLSGVAPRKSADVVQRMWYRSDGSKTLLHFGAVDWQTTVYLNKVKLGNHTGGYDGFSFDISEHVLAQGNELLVWVYDPTETGSQPHGKQFISRISDPATDEYTPSSGIWQTVWLESVPDSSYVRSLKIDQASLSTVTVTDAQGVQVASGSEGDRWQGKDTVFAYFGLRTFTLGKSSTEVTRPLLNGQFTFLAGFLDQSWWPDGLYTARGAFDERLVYARRGAFDERLVQESDLLATKMFGMNMIRLHQKVNPEYGGASPATVPLFVEDLKAMLEGRGNHPCIMQWTTFNEGDSWTVFTEPPLDVLGITELVKQLDPSRLVDCDSGGGANDKHYADVNDVHSYPNPSPQNEWVPKGCFAYLPSTSPANQAEQYVNITKMIMAQEDQLSAVVLTQTTDIELECDGFLNFDRSNKFTEGQTKTIHDANQAMIKFRSDLRSPSKSAADWLPSACFGRRVQSDLLPAKGCLEGAEGTCDLSLLQMRGKQVDPPTPTAGIAGATNWTQDLGSAKLAGKNIMTLYHQTTPEAAASIIKTGFRLGSADGICGAGIYFCPTGKETEIKAVGGKGYMIEAKVDMG